LSLTPQWLDELRARTTLSTLIGKTTKVQKAGREYKACCPFHNEKTPSFTINDEKGFYHCFGCGAHGDAIRWMTDQQGLPFLDAIKELAAAAGMDVPAPDPRAAKRAEQAQSLHDVTSAAQNWFVEQLGGPEGAEARAYIQKRGISAATQAAFGFGFSPDSRGKLKTALKTFPEPMLVESGMLIQPEETGRESYDRFRGRLMIPIRDQRGRVIAFGGRILSSGEPKYLNSPETPIFDKGRTLYNLDKAAPAARKSGRMVVVEGYMDAIMIAQAGITEVVAPLGTALTEAQMEKLWTTVNTPLLCFDGDSAGQRAALRAARRALPLLKPGYSLAFAQLPAGLDPDDLIRRSGVGAFEAVLSSAKPLVEFIWQSEEDETPLDTPEKRAGLKDRALKIADTIADQSVAAEYRKALNSLFYEKYGWKPKHRDQATKFHQAVRSDLKEGSMPHRVDVAIKRSVLFGLMRWPAVARKHREAIHELDMPTRHLEEWKDLILDACFEDELLSADYVQQSVEDSDLDPKVKFDLLQDLQFGFLDPETDEQSAIEMLVACINATVMEQRADQQLTRFAAENYGANASTFDERKWRSLRDLQLAKAMAERELQKFSDIVEARSMVA
jgi:DNA primase